MERDPNPNTEVVVAARVPLATREKLRQAARENDRALGAELRRRIMQSLDRSETAKRGK